MQFQSGSEFCRRSVNTAAARRRFVERFDAWLAGRRLLLWGAGRGGDLALRFCRKEGWEPAFVVDSDPKKLGSRMKGVEVVGVDGPRAGDCILVASMHADEIEAWIASNFDRSEVRWARFPLGSIYNLDFGFLLAEAETWKGARVSAAAKGVGDCSTVSLFASSEGNFYFRELRDFLGHGLRKSGFEVHLKDEYSERAEGVPVVVGPHEFFSLGRGVEWFSEAGLASVALLNTEQPQSVWFREWLPAFRNAGALLDLHPGVATASRIAGAKADWLPVGWIDGVVPFDCLPTPDGGIERMATLADSWVDRPIDVLFIGAASPRRVALLETLRSELPGLRWEARLPSDASPVGADASGAVSAAGFVDLARRSKVVLNLHRDAGGTYFELQRIVWRGLWQGALVVSERCEPPPPYREGEHFLSCSPERLADRLRWLFETEAGREEAERIRFAGWERSRSVSFEETAKVFRRLRVGGGESR